MSDRPRDGERCPTCGSRTREGLRYPCVRGYDAPEFTDPDFNPTHPWHDQPQAQNYDCPIHGLQDGPECARC